MAASADDGDAALRRNMRHICMFEAKGYPSPLPETAVTRGFEKFAYPKLVGQLRHADTIIRHKAVLAIRELMVDPLKLVQCIAAGATPALVALLAEEDSQMRCDAALTLQLLLRRELGVRDALQHAALPALLALVQRQPAAATASSPAGVRDQAYAALRAATHYECGR